MTTAAEAQDYAQFKVQVEPPKAQAAEAPSPVEPKRQQRIAVLIYHGMGQQVQFETLDAVVREVRETAQRCGTLLSEEAGVRVSLHPDEGRFIARAELKLKPKGRKHSRCDVHFYEGYWALAAKHTP